MTGRDRERIDRLMGLLERMRLDEYLAHAGNRRRLMVDSLLAGMCRGLGFTLGLSVLSTLAAALLRAMVADNIPLIGGFLAEVIHAIEARL